jgi:hypothetical protein
MKKRDLIRKIEDQAEIFKSREIKGVGDEKRHDPIERDEQKVMWIAKNELAWSFTKIGSVFDRDWRSVKGKISSYEDRSRAGAPGLCIGPSRITLFTDRLDFVRFASVEISAANGVEAKDCWGLVTVLPSGLSLPLHWRGTGFKAEQTALARIIVQPQKAANLDVAVSLPCPGVVEMPSKAEPCPEVPAFFVGSTPQPPWHGEGCWLAQPTALDNPDPRSEAYLSPGPHNIRISVGCEGGKGDVREFVLRSPVSWEGLTLVPK